MEEKCPKCNGQCVKYGKQYGKQRYRCKQCFKLFKQQYAYRAYGKDMDTWIKTLLKEGCGVRSMARILGISTKTVQSRMLKISNGIGPPRAFNWGGVYEVDEIWSFIGNKSNVVWVAYALERETKRVVDFIVGKKTKENIQPLINTLLLQNPNRIYTDKLNIYPGLVPKEIHGRSKYGTNRIERNNLTLRTHIKRLARRTICFSKNKSYLVAHLRIYFWG